MPFAVVVYACGDVHAAYVPGTGRRVQLALERRARLRDVNVNDGAVPFVGPVGPPVIVVSGATVSTVNARVAGEASVLPAASVARTENV